MWIHDYPNWQMNFDSKKWCEAKIFLWNQSINSFIPIRRMHWWRPMKKRKEIITWIHVYPSWKMNINSKIGRKRSFSYETKASIIFIPMRRISLWCPIMKKKEIIMWIHIILINKWTLILKNGRQWSFSYETKALIHLPNEENEFVACNH